MKYSVIYADPPWWYHDHASTLPTVNGSNGSTGYVGADGKRHNARPIPYFQMKEEDLKKLPIRDLAAKDCTLFCWATSPLLPQAFRVIEAWGFEYKAILAWDKVRQLVSQYTRGNLELLLVGGRGKSKPITQKGLPSAVYRECKTAHSVKPEWFVTDYIDKFWPEGNRIELFARRTRPGWDVWGNEAPDSVDLFTN